MTDTPSLEERVAALEAITAKLTEPAILRDCRVDYFRDGMQGGGVRITHLPTGLSAEGRAATGTLKDLTRELTGDLARMLEESGKATDGALPYPPSPPPLTPDQVRYLLRECVTVVKPGETLVIQGRNWTPNQVRDMQEALDDMHGSGRIPFQVLAVFGDELGVAEFEL